MIASLPASLLVGENFRLSRPHISSASIKTGKALTLARDESVATVLVQLSRWASSYLTVGLVLFTDKPGRLQETLV